MLNLAGQLKASTEGEMALEHLQGARAELNQPIRRGLGPILVARHDTRLADADLALGDIAVADEQRDLLGRPQAREEPKLIVVALRLAPVAMDRDDQGLGLLDAERIDDRPILLGDAQAFEAGRRIVPLGRIAIAVVKGAAQSADDIVVGLFGRRVCVGDSHEFGIPHFRKQPCPELRAPDVGQNLPVAVGGREGEVVLGHARIDMQQEFVEHVVAGASNRHARDVLLEAVVGKLLCEGEGSVCNAFLDPLQLQARAAQVRFRRCTLERRAIAHAVEFKIELNPVGAERTHAAIHRLSTHL